jgi:predicted phosphodiesterase
MSRVAAIHDIHGNLPALEAVLLEMSRERVDEVVVGGDVLPGPMPCETLERLQDIDVPVHFIVGNGDREVLARMTGAETNWYRTAPDQWKGPIQWTARQLYSDHRVLLASWPSTCSLAIPGLGTVLFCHATPRSDTEVFTRLTLDDHLLPIFEPAGASIVVCGHTHMQFDRRVGPVRIVNAGSIGMPFGRAGAYWLLLGPDIELRCTPYDLEKAAARIRGTDYPQAEQFAAKSVLQPPSEEEMLAAFTGIELKADPGAAPDRGGG